MNATKAKNDTSAKNETPAADVSSAAGETQEHAQCREELRQEHDRYLRALADFENYRRRVARDQERMAQAGKRDLVIGLLPVLDDFERALNYLDSEAADVAEGLRATYRRLLAQLEGQGIKPFDSVGMPFDPAQHEAIGSAPDSEYRSGTVAEELRRGYRWGDEVLRPAQVRVAA